MTTRLRAGVVGAGKMGGNHARLYRDMPDVDLVGVADTDPEAAERAAAEYATQPLPTDTLLSAVNIVSIAVPTPAHADLVEACIDAGVHVLVEKPFVTNLERGRELIAAADSAGLTLQVGHVERFNPAVRTLTDIIADLDVIAIDAERLGPPINRSLGTSVVFDLMIHDIDIASALLDGEVVSIDATGTRDGEYAAASCVYDDDVVATFTASRVTQQKVRKLGITAEDCRIEVDYMDQSIEIHRGSLPEYVQRDGEIRHRTESVVERPFVENGEPLKHELTSFVDAVRSGTRPVVTAEDGLRAVELAANIENHIPFRHPEEVTI